MSTMPNAVELTRRLVQFNTVNPPGNERECARYLGGLLESVGFSVRYYEFAEARTTLVATCMGSGSKKPLCFTGHLDVVPLGQRPWSVDPFAAAAAEMQQMLAKGPGVVLVITAGEETGSAGAFQVARLGASALGEAGAIVVAEPTGNYPMVGHRGALWLKLCTRGVTAHGSMPHKGVNAIYKMSRIVNKLERFKFDISPHPVMGACTLNVGTISGGLNINSVPDHSEIGIDIRTVPGAEHEQLKRSLRDYLAPELEGMEALIDFSSVWTDPSDRWVQEVFEIMASILKKPIEPAAAPYFTDAAALTPAYGGVPTIILGPGEIEMAHQTDEFCYVTKIEQAAAAYRAIIERWHSTSHSA